MMNFTASYTFRLLIPLCLGIVAARIVAPMAGSLALGGYDGTTWMLGGCLAGMLLLMVGMGILMKREQSLYMEKFGLTLTLTTFLLGGALYLLEYRNVKVDWENREKAYEGYLFDRPVAKKKHLRCPVQVEGHRVWLYLPADSLSHALRRGDEVRFYGRVTFSDTAKYDRIYFHQGVSGTAFVRTGHWQPTGRRHPLSFRQHALACRDRIVGLYRSWGLQGDKLAVLSALTVGQTDELSTDVRSRFSAAGFSHILALSGLHVGLIWSILTCFFPNYIERRSLRWLRLLFVSVMMLVYVFVAGLPPSAVRAVWMCIFWEANCCISTEYTHRLHSLLSVTFLMLLVQPFYLFQLSFQLSVMAVGVILAFYEPIQENFLHRYGYRAQKLSFLYVPVVAQLGVAPISLYYFNTFPVYFLLGSLLAVWMAEAIVYLTVVLLLTMWMGSIHALGCLLMDKLLWALIAMAQWVSHLPHALVRIEGFTGLEVVTMYLFVLILYRWVTRR